MDTSYVYTRALDWLWAVIAGAFVLVGRAFVRLYRHEERIQSLEASRAERIRQMADLAEKVDANHQDTTARLDAIAEDIRADLRIIMNRCLMGTHRDTRD
jgi:hypothetical protein